ncbi:MAG TPA: VOC family protein [Jatrophihabitans sp.]|nr:VOC family protein [Jatrophihabitans sp.]
MVPAARLTAFVATTDLDRAAAFYVDLLGLTLLGRDSYAAVVDGQGAQLRITPVQAKAPAEYTVLGWEVPDLDAAVDDLRARGVTFTLYPGMDQDEHDAWRAPDGTRVAWFADPDGNTLSLHQHATG